MSAEFDVNQQKNVPKQFHSDMEQILRQINQAYAVLKDDKSRREYRLKLIEKDKVVQSAELLAKKGEMDPVVGREKEIEREIEKKKNI